jgi:hypothetical protein
MKEKSLPLAIGLNILLPGLGYMYMGKWIVGILACLLVFGIYATTGFAFLVPTWIVINVIMGIDMAILSSRTKEDCGGHHDEMPQLRRDNSARGQSL